MDQLEALHLSFRLEFEREYTASEERIGLSTTDLADLTRLVDFVSTRVAERAAWQFVVGLGLPGEQLGAMIDTSTQTRLSRSRLHRLRAAPGPGQVTAVEEGSIIIGTTLIGGLVLHWALKNFLGEAVVEGWKESVGREKLKNAARAMFGGASEVARGAAAERMPERFVFEQFSLEPATGGAPRISLGFRKLENPEARAWVEGETLFADASGDGWVIDDSDSPEAERGWTLIDEDSPKAKNKPARVKAKRASSSTKKREMGA